MDFSITAPHESRVLGPVECVGTFHGTRLLLNWRSGINGAMENGVVYLPLAACSPQN